jgi:hypothetical protein
MQSLHRLRRLLLSSSIIKSVSGDLPSNFKVANGRFSAFQGVLQRTDSLPSFGSCRPYTYASSPTNIFALSTAPGRAAIAIIRISGPDCLRVLQNRA